MRPGHHHSRKAITLLAAFTLILHALLLGSAVSSMPNFGMTASFHAEVECAEHAGSHDQGDEQHKKRDHSICCILCGKIGSATGPASVALVPAAPQSAQAVTFGQGHAEPVETASVLPVGARAPPLGG